jgi:uncharacterized membrane protein YcaP (DUF421 family)
MKAEEIHWGDWHRILFGTAPAAFLIEVLIRTLIIYLALLIILRLMGKRMGGQLTISELSVMLTLGAIISVPMQTPDKGILQGILVLVGALFFQRGLNYLAVRNKKLELLTQGSESILVKNGVLQSKELKGSNISREQIIAVLRNEQIYNLGEIRRVYLEASGLFTIFKYPQPKPGLLLIPATDQAGPEFYSPPAAAICEYCGNASSALPQENPEKCNNCGADIWTAPTMATAL